MIYKLAPKNSMEVNNNCKVWRTNSKAQQAYFHR